MNQKELKQLSLLAEVASLYYERDLTQSEIAKRLCLSRTRISRLLQQARDRGVVEIKIHYAFERSYDLESRLKERFGLGEVRLLNNRNHLKGNLKQAVGTLAAHYLQERISQPLTIGVSWGSTIAETVGALHSIQVPIPIRVVQLMGALSVDHPERSAHELVRKLADLYGGEAFYLNAPLFVEDEYVKSAISSDPLISKVLGMAAASDIILTGVSAFQQKAHADNPWFGYIDGPLLEELSAKQAVGCICAHFYDKDGVQVDGVWNRQCIGIGLEDLKRAEEVVVVAAGLEKAPAILGALRGGYVNVLISDSDTANAMIDLL